MANPKKAIETLRKRGYNFSKKSENSWRNKIRPSELKYKNILMKKYGISETDIIHGASGFPDWMLLTKRGRLHFYEIKSMNDKLNDLQIGTIHILIKSKKCLVYLVTYIGAGKSIKYKKPKKLTLKNLKNY